MSAHLSWQGNLSAYLKRLLLTLPLFTTLLLINGCAQTVNSVLPEAREVSGRPLDKATLDEGYGYLLMAVKTSQTIETLRIEGEVDVILTDKDLKKGTNYIMVPLPQGKYRITEIRLPFATKFTFGEDDYWEFTVTPDTISYIGDLTAEFSGWLNSRIYYGLENRSSYALMFLEKHYPEILTNNAMIYGGFGEDKFLEEMSHRRLADAEKTQSDLGAK